MNVCTCGKIQKKWLLDNALPASSIQSTCFSIAACTLSLLWAADTGWLQMTNNAKLCKSCSKEAKTLHHGYCEKCLSIHVVKDWLKKDGVK